MLTWITWFVAELITIKASRTPYAELPRSWYTFLGELEKEIGLE